MNNMNKIFRIKFHLVNFDNLVETMVQAFKKMCTFALLF